MGVPCSTKAHYARLKGNVGGRATRRDLRAHEGLCFSMRAPAGLKWTGSLYRIGLPGGRCEQTLGAHSTLSASISCTAGRAMWTRLIARL